MNKIEKWTVALLTAIALEGAYSAYEIRRIARDGFQMELTLEQADSLAVKVLEAKEQALKDMEGEGNEW